MNTPQSDNSDPLLAALRRDAARIQEPPFDAALHHAAIRRIRALEEKGTVWWRPAHAWAAGFIALAMAAGLWLSRNPQSIVQRPPLPPPDFSPVLAAARTAAAGSVPDHFSPLPAWMSPTDSLLSPLHLSSSDSQQPL